MNAHFANRLNAKEKCPCKEEARWSSQARAWEEDICRFMGSNLMESENSALWAGKAASLPVKSFSVQSTCRPADRSGAKDKSEDTSIHGTVMPP